MTYLNSAWDVKNYLTKVGCIEDRSSCFANRKIARAVAQEIMLHSPNQGNAVLRYIRSCISEKENHKHRRLEEEQAVVSPFDLGEEAKHDKIFMQQLHRTIVSTTTVNQLKLAPF